jgi:hypothetical protein
MEKKVELKKVKYYEKMSEETSCFTADIYFNGKKVGLCKNSGNGGETYVYQNLTNQDGYKQFLSYCRSLGKNSVDMCDELFDKYMERRYAEKLEKKLKRDQQKGIVYCESSIITNKYNIYYWRNKTLLEVIEKRPDLVKDMIEKLRSEGNSIFNTNIPKELM